MSTANIQAHRGTIVHWLSDPKHSPEAMQWFSDGLLIIKDGHVSALGPAEALLPQLAQDIKVHHHEGKIIMPGFVDTHNHYAQNEVIASYGEQLLSWLTEYTFPAEAKFASAEHAQGEAEFFIQELLKNGTTTALTFATIHPNSVDAIFSAAQKRRMRLIAGKVLMDRHCPDYLRDTPESAEIDSRALIEKWHNNGRLRYALTPRFAPTSTAEQMKVAGDLFQAYPDIYLQSHVAENRLEVEWVRTLYPESRSYLDVYDRFGQLGERSVLAHCIWLDEIDRQRMAASGAAMSFCPTSNLFLGSGLFNLEAADSAGVRVSIGTDVGGGTSYSMLYTLNEAYKVLQMGGQKIDASRAFYFATLGGARALYVDDRIGNFNRGREADFVVLDLSATDLLAYRTARCRTLDETLFALMMLGDDRAIDSTYIMGEKVWCKTRASDETFFNH